MAQAMNFFAAGEASLSDGTEGAVKIYAQKCLQTPAE